MIPAKYDRIGRQYNSTRKADPQLVDHLFRLLQANPQGHYLDIGCGTGNYTHALSERGIHFTGVDPSNEMLDKARLKNPALDWKLGTAEAIPLSDESVDGVMGSLTMHHWSDLKKGFRELYRVCKTGTKMVLFTATPLQMRGYWLNHYFPQMLEDSMQQMPAEERLTNAMAEAGFHSIQREKYFIHSALEDLFLYSGKQRPELYLDEQVRRGISSFSALANRQEVAQGLARLEADINRGKIMEIIQRYNNEGGDYLYLTCLK